MGRVIIIALVVVLVGVVGVGGYMLGRQLGLTEAQNIQREFFQQRAGQNGQGALAQGSDPTQTGQPGGQGQRAGAGAAQAGRQIATGTVKSISGNTITVTQQDGTTTTVTIDDKTTVQKTTNGTAADIQPGWRITVVEQTTGGSTTRRVQLTQGQ
jgi:hypothetical protein